jgi:glutamate synthase (NADPH/NADH) small chain
MLHPGEVVVEAIGQATDVELLGEELKEALEWNRGRLKVDENGRTNLEWLWAAGDMVRGPDVVSAVADGHRIAASINETLSVQEKAA